MEGGGLAGGNARFPPLEQATRRAWGNLLTLACLGDGGHSPSKRRQATIAKLVWQSRCQTWQDKPVGRCKMDQQNPSYISCTEDEQKDDVLIFFRDTLEKQIEAVVDTISPLYGDDFTQAHWK